ncbi:high mobility group B protein 13-like [Andrographis paniculata]|uniref:high mobility group B protein 13-like n=1 Tax=Andrographis paniculata TaxID=175694 RepID=UPI0021E8B0C7|nr:high mobility group B protein 13-like [Andrographis paniculata]
MAAVAETPNVVDPAPTKKGRTRKPLKSKTTSSSEANIAAGTVSVPSPVVVAPPTAPEISAGKENQESLVQKKTKKGAAAKGKKQQQQQSEAQSSLEEELQKMQEQLQKLKLEKEQTDEILKKKEEELETKDKEQEKLKIELKKLQKIKEFKPTMTLPFGLSVKDHEQDKKDKKKNATKRPSPPYILWFKDLWNEVKKANPEADFKEMSNLLGAKWKSVSAEEKKPYEERYQAEKEAYLKVVGNEKREQEAMKLLEEEQKQKTAMELLEQYLQFKQESEKENKKTKKTKDPLKPKQPMSAYFIYSNERRTTLLAKNKNILEVAKATGEEWKSMTEEQRAPYEQMAMKNKEQYMEEMEVYKKKKEEEASNLKREEEELQKLQKQEALQLLKKKEKTETLIKKTKEKKKKEKKGGDKIVDPNKPKKPASSFLLFSKDARKNLAEERPGISNSTLNALISVKWKELSEEEKRVWNDKAAKAMEAYKKELESYTNKLAEAEQE